MTPRKQQQPVPAIEPEEKDEVLRVLLDLEANDKLHAETVVAVASDPASPLHPRFVWDDAIAGHQFRLAAARSLIGRYHIRIETSPDVQVILRRFTHVPSEGRYKRTERSLAENGPEVRGVCRAELESFKRKWSALEDLNKIVAEVFAAEHAA